MYRNLLFLINLFFVPVLNADILFKDLTNTVKENFPSRYYGLAITDINNDGNFDLIVSNFEGTQHTDEAQVPSGFLLVQNYLRLIQYIRDDLPSLADHKVRTGKRRR